MDHDDDDDDVNVDVHDSDQGLQNQPRKPYTRHKYEEDGDRNVDAFGNTLADLAREFTPAELRKLKELNIAEGDLYVDPYVQGKHDYELHEETPENIKGFEQYARGQEFIGLVKSRVIRPRNPVAARPPDDQQQGDHLPWAAWRGIGNESSNDGDDTHGFSGGAMPEIDVHADIPVPENPLHYVSERHRRVFIGKLLVREARILLEPMRFVLPLASRPLVTPATMDARLAVTGFERIQAHVRPTQVILVYQPRPAGPGDEPEFDVYIVFRPGDPEESRRITAGMRSDEKLPVPETLLFLTYFFSPRRPKTTN
jgi:hypothetical protein